MNSSTSLDESSSADILITLRRWIASSIIPRLSSGGIHWRSSLGWRLLLTIKRQCCLMLIMETPTRRIPSFCNWRKSKALILLNPLVLSTRHISLLLTLKSKYIWSMTTNKMICIRHAWWNLLIRLVPILTLTILASYHFVPLSSYLNWKTLRHVLVTPVTLNWLYKLLRRSYSTLEPIFHPL